MSTVSYSAVQAIQVGVNRWLEVRQVKGTVIYQKGTVSNSAQVGIKLQNVGDSVKTGKNSNAVLAVDTGIGVVKISENTTVRVRSLEVLPGGGHITHLQVTQGQARLQVRRFTNSGSRLEIQTPAGISGVRGTQFGVTVQPDGKTGVATLEGAVVTSAQGKSVRVSRGLQSLVIPGEAPSPAVALKEDTRMKVQILSALNAQTARIKGNVDSVNLVIVNDQPIVMDRKGQFDVQLPLPSDRIIRASVVTPLGKHQEYRLAIP
ncbi:MAG: FecR family protein [Leptolyngbyaceae bacterium]|nr:FecR family protein [Leptolyngbyaceae bacterium]